MRKYKCIKPKKRKVKNSIYKSNINKQNVKVNIMGTPSLGGSISHMHIPHTVPFYGGNPYNFTDLNKSIKSLKIVIKQNQQQQQTQQQQAQPKKNNYII